MTLPHWVAVPVDGEPHRLGEGPHWDAQRGRLSWVDIPAGALWVDDGLEKRRLVLGDELGVAVPHADGGWVCGLGPGLALLSEDGAVLQRVDVEPVGVRMNDGKCDRAGRFFVGSKAHDNTAGAGNLWRLDLDGSIARVLDGLTISNGLGWSPDDSTMYVTDSAAGLIQAYEYDAAAGELGSSRLFLRAAPGDGVPDGLAVDAEGYLWVAYWDAGQVRRYAPSGQPAGVVTVDASLTTSCAFSGPTLSTLSITTAWDELDEEQRAAQPLAGLRFRADVGVKGVAGMPCRAVRSGWSQAVAAE